MLKNLKRHLKFLMIATVLSLTVLSLNLTEGKNIDKNKAREVIGNEFYLKLLEIKDGIKLDKMLFGYFNRCFMVNEVLAKHNFFLKPFERRDKFRFLIKKAGR